MEKQFKIMVEEKQLRTFKAMAALKGKSMGKIIRQAITDYIENNKVVKNEKIDNR